MPGERSWLALQHNPAKAIMGKPQALPKYMQKLFTRSFRNVPNGLGIVSSMLTYNSNLHHSKDDMDR